MYADVDGRADNDVLMATLQNTNALTVMSSTLTTVRSAVRQFAHAIGLPPKPAWGDPKPPLLYS